LFLFALDLKGEVGELGFNDKAVAFELCYLGINFSLGPK
jgi:hypothetical protein